MQVNIHGLSIHSTRLGRCITLRIIPARDYLFFYRQSARSAGIGIMIMSSLFVTIVIVAAALFFRETAAWIFAAIWTVFCSLFFVYGLRRVIYGGQWGCFVDHEHMTWVSPHRTGWPDEQIAVRDITKFVEEIQTDSDSGYRHYFVETANGRFQIDSNCFGYDDKLRRALREANRAIDHAGGAPAWAL